MTLACWLWFQTVDRLLDYTRDNAVEELLALLVSLVYQRRKTSSAKEGTITIPMNSKKGDFLPCCPATHFTSSGLSPPWLARASPWIQKTQPNLLESLSLSFSLGQRGSTSMTIVVNKKQASHIHLTMSIATFETTVGTFKAELYTAQMPITWYVRWVICTIETTMRFSWSPKRLGYSFL